jgi:hypothetical protein
MSAEHPVIVQLLTDAVELGDAVGTVGIACAV